MEYKLISINDILLIARYMVIAAILLVIFVWPAILAAKNESSKLNIARTRFASWLFGWSFFGYIIALFLSTKK